MKRLIKGVVFAAMLSSLYSTQSLATKLGGDTSGGGASLCVNTDDTEAKDCASLLDTQLRRSRVDVTKLPAFQNRVEPILKNLEEKVPDLATLFRGAISTKRWYLVNAEIPSLGAAVNQTKLPIKQRAYQNSKIVVMNNTWFKSRDEEEQGDMILHELAVSILLGYKEYEEQSDYAEMKKTLFLEAVMGVLPGEKTDMDDIRGLVEYLHDAQKKTAGQIQKYLSDNSIGGFLVADQYKTFVRARNTLLQDMNNACNKSSAPIEAGANENITLQHVALHEAYTKFSEARSPEPKTGKVKTRTAIEAQLHWAFLSHMKTAASTNVDLTYYLGNISQDDKTLAYELIKARLQGATEATDYTSAICSYAKSKYQSMRKDGKLYYDLDDDNEPDAPTSVTAE